jgi:RND family efflux transporter MFP subunit
MADEDLSGLKIDKSTKTIRSVRRIKPVYMAAAFAALIVLSILYLKGVFSQAVAVEITTVSRTYPSQAFTTLNASGYVVAQRKAAIGSKITSRLLSLSVEEGTRVKKGEIVARLEGEDVVAARDQAKANLSVARSALEQARAELNDAAASFERGKTLLYREFISKAEYDAAEARYKKAVAGVSSAEAALRAASAGLQAAEVSIEYTLLRAPFDAVVLTKNADVGDIVTPLGAAANAKASVVTIADMSSLQVEADVSESNLGQVKAGQPCEIQLDALPDKRFRGVVHMVIPTADRSKATVMVKVRFLDNDDRILPEMSAKVAFLSRPVKDEELKPKTTVSAGAVSVRDGNNVVFLVEGDKIVETPVTLGEKIGQVVEVTAGVEAGTRVVMNPSPKLKDGMKIKLAEKP